MNKTPLIILLFFFPFFLIAQENTAIACSDGIDNDGDGLIDCLDSECANLPTDMDRGCQTCLMDGLSFADTVISSNITCPTNTNNNPQAAIGVADFNMIGDDVSLGKGGSITLGFTNNLLVNSGDNNPDIWVFEVGPRVETCLIELRPADQNTMDILDTEGITDNDVDGLYDFGAIVNFTPSVDIDGIVNGYAFAELKFDAIQITDAIRITDGTNGCIGNIPGADIDAVCALTSLPILIDCAGTPNGMAILDSCRICLERNDTNFNQACLDCTGTPNGMAILDSCGVCLEPTDPSFNQTCLDCASTPNGMAILDSCGICLEPTDPSFNQTCLDCAGTPNGMAILDSCGICLELTDLNFNQTCLDCAGTPNGMAILDNCGICLEPNDPNFNQSCSQKNKIYIPNVFSPNGDGRNDKFQLFKPRELNAQVNTYLIFDRWGSLVYKASNFDFNTSVHWWDGSVNRKEPENGAYIYYIEIEIVGIKQYEGTITILK